MGRLVQLVYLMLPAYCANMAPPFVRYWRGWNPPLWEKGLGSHKTALGFGLGVATALVVTYIQSRIQWRGDLMAGSHWMTLGLVMGAMAMLGDSAKSYLKRRIGIPPGQPWIPADQLDYAIAVLLFVAPWASLHWGDVASILALTFAGNIGVNQLSFRLGIRNTKW